MKVSAPTRQYTAVAKALRQWLAAHHAQDRKPVRAFLALIDAAMDEAGEADKQRIMGAGPKYRTTRLVTHDTPALRRRARRAA